eukprot:PITA_19999
MATIVSTYFRKIEFPFQGGITIIDQLAFFPNSSQATGSIPLIHGSSQSLQNVGVGLLKDPSLMGTFSLSPPTSLVKVATVETCHMISSTSSKIKKNSDHFDSVDHQLEIYCALFREFRDIFAWSYEEMPGIDSRIVEHEIKMYPDVKLVRQRLRPIHPKKDATIKAEVEKLLHAGFIYPIPLTNWVLNIVPVMKKRGTIRVCFDYRDVNQACPKKNYPTPFIDQIIDECAG